MQDTIQKVRALINMKTCLINALQDDHRADQAKIDELTTANRVLSREVISLRQELRDAKEWWRDLDKDMGRKEVEEVYGKPHAVMNAILQHEDTMNALRINKKET